MLTEPNPTRAWRHKWRSALWLAMLMAGAVAPAVAETLPCPPSGLAPLPLPAFAAAVASGGPVVIVAIGSSSTEGIGASEPSATYPARLQANLRAALPGRQITVVNKGVGGQDAAEMLLRLEEDVLSHGPALAIWQVGTNGALRRQSPERFRQMMRDGVARVRAAGTDVLLMDSQRGAWARAAPEREAFDRALADLATQRGVALFRRGGLMDGWAEAGTPPEAMLTADGLHHNDRGYACLAAAVADSLISGLPAQVARVALPASRER